MPISARSLPVSALAFVLLVARSGESAAEIPGANDAPVLVPSFYVRAVTGPLMNRSVCYVCRNGSRPVVLVVVRKTGPELEALLRGVDEIVDRHRADGLRSFGVVVCGDPQREAPAVQTFAFDGKIAMPLCVAPDAVAGPGGLELDAQTEVSVVLYRNRRIEAKHLFRDGELNESSLPRVLDSVRAFAAVKPAADPAD